jgi:uncharacterized protein YlaI
MKHKTVQVECLICNKKLNKDQSTEEPTNSIGAVYEGLVCRTYGNYGSALYDPIATIEEFLEFYVCDECIEKNAKKIQWVKYEKKFLPVKSYSFAKRLAEEKKEDTRWLNKKEQK